MTTITLPRREDSPSAQRDSVYPIVIQRVDGFLAAHTASFEAVSAALPTDSLHPVRLPNGRALIAVALYQKRAATAGSGASTLVFPPYAELMISAVVTRRPMSRASAMLALAGPGSSKLGGFTLQFALTSRTWRDGVRGALGAPAFVADFDLDVSGSDLRLRVSEGERDVVSARVSPGGGLRRIHDVQTGFGALDGKLMATRTETEFVARRRRGGAMLELGSDHPVADALRRLDVSRRAFMTDVWHDGRVILLAPEPVGVAGPYPCHPGLEVPFGRYTVRYAGTPPIDQYEAGDLCRDPMALDAMEGRSPIDPVAPGR